MGLQGTKGGGAIRNGSSPVEAGGVPGAGTRHYQHCHHQPSWRSVRPGCRSKFLCIFFPLLDPNPFHAPPGGCESVKILFLYLPLSILEAGLQVAIQTKRQSFLHFLQSIPTHVMHILECSGNLVVMIL